MIDPVKKDHYSRLRERLRDPLLAVLTILLALIMFVIAPLHAAGAIESSIGYAGTIIVIGVVLFQSGVSAAFIVMLIGLGLSTTATVLRLQQPSILDLYLDASAWILIGLALSWVVAHAVFAPGRIPYHRIMGAILLYLSIGLTFVALYTFVGLLVPDAFSGMAVTDTPTLASTIIYYSFETLTTAGSGYCAAASDRAQPEQRGGDDRPALSGNIAGETRSPLKSRTRNRAVPALTRLGDSSL